MNSREKTVIAFLVAAFLVGAGVHVHNEGRKARAGARSPIAIESQVDTTRLPVLLVDLNTAKKHELEALPGIGPALARRIIAWRESNSGFKRTDELLKVPGIGPRKYAAIRELVTIGDENPDLESEAIHSESK